ncbi:MAG: hypothetical protein E4H36_09480 [Spirochaetales bacterium]|nr:MAG: hypothetical protein E4H36_09480 [Spirochaetales bacterium]
MSEDKSTSFPKLFFLWLPLAVMWLVMAAEQPAITSIIARLGEAKIQLAAFGYTFALALLIEGPVMQMLAAGTAVSDTADSYKKILKVMHVLGAGCTIAHLLLAIPAVFHFVASDMMNIPPELLKPAWQSFLVLVPWAATIGYRRLWQGILIKHNRAGAVPITMYIRLAVTGTTLALGLITKKLPGAVLGALSLSLGVIAGALAAGLFARPVIKNSMPEKREGMKQASQRDINRFYFPLGLTSLITLGSRPLLNFGIARGLFPLESLAVWPVIMAFLFVFTSISLSLQEIVIAQLKGSLSRKSLTAFVTRIALGLFIIYILILVSPLRRLWFQGVSGLPGEILSYTPWTATLLTPVPLVLCFTSLFRGVLVHEKKTGAVSLGVAINVGILLVLLFLGAAFLPLSGAHVAAGAFTVAYVAEAVFLALRTRRIVSV